MPKCPVCQKNAVHKCPVCKNKFCEEHLLEHDCKPRKLPKTRNYNNLAYIPLVIFIFSIVYLLFLSIQAGEFSKKIQIGPEPEVEPEITYETVPMNIEYKFNNSQYNQEVVLYGFLRKKKIGIGYMYYIKDDHGNEISLFMTDPEIKAIVDNSEQSQLYKVIGILKQKHMGEVIEVTSIIETERPTVIKRV